MNPSEEESIVYGLGRRVPMRISIQVCIEGAGAQPSKRITVGVIECKADFAPGSGLGLESRAQGKLIEVANHG